MTALNCLLCEGGSSNAILVRQTAVSLPLKFPGDVQRDRKSQGYNYLRLMKWQLCSALAYAPSHLDRQFLLARGSDPFYPHPRRVPQAPRSALSKNTFLPPVEGQPPCSQVCNSLGETKRPDNWEGEASGPCLGGCF